MIEMLQKALKKSSKEVFAVAYKEGLITGYKDGATILERVKKDLVESNPNNEKAHEMMQMLIDGFNHKAEHTEKHQLNMETLEWELIKEEDKEEENNG